MVFGVLVVLDDGVLVSVEMADCAMLWVPSQRISNCATAENCSFEACGCSLAMGPIGNDSWGDPPSICGDGSSGSGGALAAAVVEIGGSSDMVMGVFDGFTRQ